MGTRTARATLVLGLTAWSAGCASVDGFTADVKGLFGAKGNETTLSSVDRLVRQVEGVHHAAETAKARAHGALERLETLASPAFGGDPVEAYREYLAAVETSEAATRALGRSLEPARKSAESVFTQWEADLEVFTVQELRQRSRKRLEETRARYDAVVSTTGAAQTALDAFNLGLRDHALFLGHDFNEASIAAIQRELGALGRWSAEVDRRLDACLEATAEYVKASALPGVK